MRRLVTITIVLAAGLLVAYVGYLSVSRTDTPLAEPNLPASAADVQIISYATSTAHSEFSVRYPWPENQAVRDIITHTVLAPASTTFDSFLAHEQECLNSSMRALVDVSDIPCQIDAQIPWEISIDYEAFDGERVSSYLFSTYIYAGGVHGNGSFAAVSYDRDTGEIITMRDLVPLDREDAFVTALDRAVREWFQRAGAGELDVTLPPLEDSSAVAIVATDAGVGVAFSSYALGAYAFGTPTVFVPYSAF